MNFDKLASSGMPRKAARLLAVCMVTVTMLCASSAFAAQPADQAPFQAQASGQVQPVSSFQGQGDEAAPSAFSVTQVASRASGLLAQANAASALAAQASGDTAHANISFVQELAGRQWVGADGKNAAGLETKLAGGDSFEFRLVPLGRASYGPDGSLALSDDGTIDRETGLVAGSAADEPLPAEPSIRVSAADARVSDSQRFASFGDIAAVDAHMQDAGGASQVDYFYDLVQVIPADAQAADPDTCAVLSFKASGGGSSSFEPATGAGASPLTYAQATAEGVVGFNVDDYAWVYEGITYTGERHEVRVRFADGPSELHRLPHVSYDGRPFGSYVPVFANEYDASGRSWAHIVTHIDGRDFADTDEFSFGITNVGGSIMRPTDGTTGDVSLVTMTHITSPMRLASDGRAGNGVHFADDQRINQDVEGGEMAVLTGEGIFHSSDLNEDGEGLFVYAVNQFEQVGAERNAGFTVERVADLVYDASTEYLRYHVTDNADGTLDVDTHYYANAACTIELTVNGKVPQIKVDAQTGQPVSPDATAGYITMDAAYFRNIRAVDVPVRKVWDGIPVEDVTVHLERALFDSSMTDREIEARAESPETGARVSWERIGLMATLPRADFVDAQTGEPRNDVRAATATKAGASGKTYVGDTAIEGFNKALPMYVIGEDGTTYRAAYRLVEDDTSDAYEASYSSEEGEAVKSGDNIFVDSGTLVVTNVTSASNTANIAAVAQLVGRTWLASDAFSFKLEPLGQAAYDGEGRMLTETVDGKTVAKLQEGSAARVPMPAAPHAQAPASTAADTAVATVETSVVAEGEHLARFGAIELDTSLLVRDPTDQHLQGDFFYRLVQDTSAGKLGGVTYASKESIVHVRVRENRTAQLQVTVAYDETDQSNVATGTQFTPVFTNRYDVQASGQVPVNAYIMGRDWSESDALDFSLRAMSGAAFVPWDASGQVRLDHEGKAADGTGTMQPEGYWLDLGKQVVSRDGALKLRLKPGAAANSQQQVGALFARMKFESGDLAYTVGENGAKDDRDGSGSDDVIENAGGVAAAGLKYGRFMYAVSQSGVSSAEGDLLLDADTEYAQVLAVDNGDGTMQVTVTIFEDRYGTVPRFAPDLSAAGKSSVTPAHAVTFVNQTTCDIQVEKRWEGVVDADVTVKLQKSTAPVPAETDWQDVPGASIVFFAEDMQMSAEGAQGFASFDALPCFERGDDDIDLNDEAISYRVVEDTPGADKFEATYGESGSPTPVVAQPGVVQLVVNKSTYTAAGTARISVVKELVGRQWLSADPQAQNYSPNVPEGDRFEFDLVALGKGDYSSGGLVLDEDGLATDDTFVKDAAGAPVTDGIPLPEVPAFAVTDGDADHHVSDSQRLADFGSVNLSLDDMTRLPDGRMVGDYFYRIVETPPDNARAWVLVPDPVNGRKYVQVGTDSKRFGTQGANNETLYWRAASPEQRAALVWEYKGVSYDRSVHQLRIHFEDVGAGSFVPEVSFDGNEMGHTAPVFTNVYDAEGSNKAHVIAHIEGRDWNAADKFEFRVTSVGGAAFDPAAGQEGAATVESAVWTTGVMNGGGTTASGLPLTAVLANGDRAMVTGEGVFHLSDLVPGADGKPASGQFVYQVQEIDPSNATTTKNASPTLGDKIADLDYDDSIVYLRITVTDNLDGTLSTRNEYFRDAACMEPLADAEGNPYLVLVDDAEDVVGAGTPEAARAYEVPAAYFDNQPAATNVGRIAAVEQLIGRVWLQGDVRTIELVPLGRAAYGADGAIQTEASQVGGKLVKAARLEEGSAVWIPMPERATRGTGDARVAVAQASLDTPAVAEGEHLANFADIPFGLGDLSFNVAEQRMAGDFYYLMRERIPQQTRGIAYDESAHMVHIAVRETGPNMIGCFVYYDEADAADIATGTQFAPVFTNRYSATGSVPIAVSTTMGGRDWNIGESFDYELRAMAGAPFVTSDDVVRLDQNGLLDGQGQDYYLAQGRQVVTRNGALRMRLSSSSDASGSIPLEGSFTSAEFSLDDLAWEVGQNSAADESDRYGARTISYTPDAARFEGEFDASVPEGLAYGKFTYAVNQVAGADAAVSYDTTTEYAQVLVIDRGDGTLDVSVHIYDDRYGTTPRYDAGNGLPVTTAQFANVAQSEDFRAVDAAIVWLDAAGKVADAPAGAAVELALVGTASDGRLVRAERTTVTGADGLWDAGWSVPKDLSAQLLVGMQPGYTSAVASTPGPDGELRFTVTMTPLPAPAGDTLDVAARVVWLDDADRDGLRQALPVSLQRQTGASAWEDVGGLNAAANGADARVEVGAQPDERTLRWTGLPAAKDGARIGYRVAPLADVSGVWQLPAGYFAIVTHETNGAFTLWCVHVPDTRAMVATVKWLDLDDAASTRPASVRLALLADGSEFTPEVDVQPDAAGNWSYTWHNLPANGSAGAIAYDVAAVGLSGYDLLGSPVQLEGAVARCTLLARSRTVTKQMRVRLRWQDANGADFTPGAAFAVDTVTLRLVRVGNGAPQIVEGLARTVAASTSDEVVWEGLAAYDGAGEEVFYSVAQDALEGFSTYYVPDFDALDVSEVSVVNHAQTAALTQPVKLSKATTKVILNGASGLVYDGAAKRPAVVAVIVNGRLLAPSAYQVSYANNVNAGTATVKVTGTSGCTGEVAATFVISKAPQKVTLKAKKALSKIKRAKLLKKNVKVKRASAFKINGAVGKVSFKKINGNKRIKVSSSGKLTVKKGLGRGSYKVCVRITAKETGNYAKTVKMVRFRVRVR